jgi:hypothetical protein
MPEDLSAVSGPVLGLSAVLVFVMLLRWAFSGGRSLIERRPRPGGAGQYGLLVPVAEPATFVEAELLRRRLEDAGIRATVAQTTEGPRVMVFSRDATIARGLLSGH